MTAPKPKLRWFQFSLRTLLIVVTLFAILCSWLGVKMRQAEREREAAAAIENLGGGVRWSEPTGPKWFRSVVGDDYFRHVEDVVMSYAKDADLENLKVMDQLEVFVLREQPGSFRTTHYEVTDIGIGNLKGLNQMQGLHLGVTNVTDAGLENLKGMSKLAFLDLAGTKITDAGLKHLKGLNQLQGINLGGTKVTDAGLKYLQMDQLWFLNLGGNNVTDAAIELLKGSDRLQEFGLNSTKVTDAGLEHLKRFSKLERLDLRKTQVTDAGVEKLQQALPNCKIEH